MMSEGEQKAILEGFRALLLRLQQHDLVSIHIRTRPYDISSYLYRLHQAQQEAASEDIYEMVVDHDNFVRMLASEHAVLQREFYIRVSARPEKPKRKLLPEEIFDRVKATLDRKCYDIIEDLNRSSLSGSRLNDEELAQYYLSCIHSHYAEQLPLSPLNLTSLDLPPRSTTLSDMEAFFNEENGNVSDESVEAALASNSMSVVTNNDEQEAVNAGRFAKQTRTTGKIGSDKKPKPEQKPAKKWSFWEGKKKPEPEPTPFSTLIELLQPAFVEQRPHFLKIHKEETEYFRARAVIGYPAFVVAGWLDQLIQIDEPYVDIMLYLETLDPRSFAQKLTRKITSFRATQEVDGRSGRTEDPYIEAALEDVETLRQQIVAQTEQVHAVSLYIGTRSTTIPELRQRDEKVLSMLRSLDLESVELSFEHLYAWQTFLPDNRDLPRHRKILDTSSVVTAFPFATSSLSTEPGSLVGVMSGGSLVIINPVSDQLENGHEIVFARSGAGKSYSEKVRLARNLQIGMEAIVIDPEDEYLPLCRKFGGANIRLSPGRLQINPFDLAHVDATERNILEEKFQSLLVLFDLLLADKDPGTLSQREKAYLTRCLTRVYADKGITANVATHLHQPPNMYDLHKVLATRVCGEDPTELASRLERYLNSFPYETEVSLDNPLVVFNIRDLSDEYKPVGLFLITDFTWTQVRRQKRPRPRLLIIDEAWVLMQFSEGGRFLASMARRARKYNLCLRVITQDVEDFLGSESGRTILKNASCKWLMKQDSSTIDIVSQTFRLSESERRFLLSCNRGEGLFFCNLSHVPLQIIASPVEHELATTNVQELLNAETLEQAKLEQAQHLAQKEAIALEQRRNEFNVVLPSFYTANVKDND